MQSSKLEATDAWLEAGGTGVRHKEDSFMEQPKGLQGTMIGWKMLLKYCRLKITRERQMDGMTDKRRKICKMVGLRELVDRVHQKKSQKWMPTGAKATARNHWCMIQVNFPRA